MPPPQPQHSVAPDRRPRERPHTPGARGANALMPSSWSQPPPQPPHARGEPGRGRPPRPRRASTPACAGQTRTTRISRPLPMPLPPRARGKLRRRASSALRAPSTPACAGQTTMGTGARSSRCLYPRVRGANRRAYRRYRGAQPLPPRARGKHRHASRPTSFCTSTPACAGQTCSWLAMGLWSCLYPRVRGANWWTGRVSVRAPPLPPRARGKRDGEVAAGGGQASTPACAGQTPRPTSSRRRPAPLPPRARGKR